MKSKRNNKLFKEARQTEYTFFYGAVPGEIKQIRGIFAQACRRNNIPTNIDIHVSRQICCQIPSDQARLVARARGEKFERNYANTELKILIL